MRVFWGMVCLGFGSAACAQDNFDTGTATAASPTSEQPVRAAADSDWKPKLLITLSLTPGGGSRIVEQEIPIHEVKLENGPNGRPREIVTQRQQKVRIQKPGRAILVCDEASVSVTSTGEQLQHHVSCKGRVCLLTNGLRITADSLELKDGQITLEDATIENPGFSASATNLTLNLNVVEVSTKKFGRPVSSMATEIHPLTAYAPEAAGIDREWQPQPAPAPEFNSPSLRSAPRSFSSGESKRVAPKQDGTPFPTY